VAFSSYPNLVYAPHVYTHTFTVDQFIGYPARSSPYPPSYTFGYQTAEAEAQAMHAAIVVTEYGAASSTDGSGLSAETAAQEDTLVSGSTLWAWKGLAKTAASCWCVRWQRSSYATTADGTAGSGNPKAPVSRSDTLIASRQSLMDRVWPRAVAGTLLAYRYDPATRSFAMVAQSPGVEAGRAHDTVVYVPATVSGSVAVTGAAALVADVRAPDGSRLLYVAPTGPPSGSARYQVTVGAGRTSVAAAVTALATAPLAPISEPQARAVALQALAAAEASTNPRIKKNAALAGALSTLLLGSSDPNS
jgi:hypothetical protein